MVSEKRKTQAERRASTQAALLDAALACLCRSGLLRFTTTDVCREAGLSQGALFRYFPTKASLLAATSEHLFAMLRADYAQRFARLPASRRTWSEGAKLLEKSMADPRLSAAYELYTAARTDEELQQALRPIVRDHVSHLRALAHSLLARPKGASKRQIDATIDVVVLALQGLALEEMALRDVTTRRRLLSALYVLVRSLESAGAARAKPKRAEVC